jgi:NAD(P)-dependent dehydrogenase (short-subunit alcohol dehydrogenase family)
LKVAPPIMLDGFLPICEHLFGTHGSQNDMTSLHGKTVLLTGASKGIGAATAALLGRAGAKVVAQYGSDEAGAQAATAAVPVERKLLVSVDFMQPDSADLLWRAATEWAGRIDVVVCNAAVLHWYGGFSGEDDAVWDRAWAETLQVNVRAPTSLMRHAVRHFRAHGGGVLVTLSSWAAQRGTSSPEAIAYAASKAAIKAAAQTIARGYAHENILSYIIAPGLVDTGMSATAAETQGGAAAVNAGLAMGEPVPPEEIAEVIAFLATGAARHLSGATLDVNGATYLR